MAYPKTHQQFYIDGLSFSLCRRRFSLLTPLGLSGTSWAYPCVFSLSTQFKRITYRPQAWPLIHQSCSGCMDLTHLETSQEPYLAISDPVDYTYQLSYRTGKKQSMSQATGPLLLLGLFIFRAEALAYSTLILLWLPSQIKFSHSPHSLPELATIRAEVKCSPNSPQPTHQLPIHDNTLALLYCSDTSEPRGACHSFRRPRVVPLLRNIVT